MTKTLQLKDFNSVDVEKEKLSELLKSIEKSQTWNHEQLEELSKLLDMQTEWKNSNAENFEQVAFKMLAKAKELI